MVVRTRVRSGHGLEPGVGGWVSGDLRAGTLRSLRVRAAPAGEARSRGPTRRPRGEHAARATRTGSASSRCRRTARLRRPMSCWAAKATFTSTTTCVRMATGQRPANRRRLHGHGPQRPAEI